MWWHVRERDTAAEGSIEGPEKLGFIWVSFGNLKINYLFIFWYPLYIFRKGEVQIVLRHRRRAFAERLYGSKRIASFEIRGKMALIRGSYGYLKILFIFRYSLRIARLVESVFKCEIRIYSAPRNLVTSYLMLAMSQNSKKQESYDVSKFIKNQVRVVRGGSGFPRSDRVLT